MTRAISALLQTDTPYQSILIAFQVIRAAYDTTNALICFKHSGVMNEPVIIDHWITFMIRLLLYWSQMLDTHVSAKCYNVIS